MFGELIEMPCLSSLFSPFQKVCFKYFSLISAAHEKHQADRQYDDDPNFRTFRRQLFHSSLAAILDTLRPGMTTPEVALCPDGHFRRVIYSLGPYIADYPEQVLLSGIVQNWCPRYVKYLFLS